MYKFTVNCYNFYFCKKDFFSIGCHLRQSQKQTLLHKTLFWTPQRFYTVVRKCSSSSNGKNDSNSRQSSLKPSDIINEKKLDIPTLKRKTKSNNNKFVFLMVKESSNFLIMFRK